MSSSLCDYRSISKGTEMRICSLWRQNIRGMSARAFHLDAVTENSAHTYNSNDPLTRLFLVTAQALPEADPPGSQRESCERCRDPRRHRAIQIVVYLWPYVHGEWPCWLAFHKLFRFSLDQCKYCGGTYCTDKVLHLDPLRSNRSSSSLVCVCWLDAQHSHVRAHLLIDSSAYMIW